MSRICLVTGGVGFLGSHLCRRLLEQGDQVICLDNLSTGDPEHIRQLSLFDGFRFIEHDIIEPIDLKTDWIFNLACPASPPAYQADPVHTTMTCVLGTKNMLDLTKENGARIFHASTSEVYGDPTVHPQTEDYLGAVSCTGLRSCYDEGKRCAESLIYSYQRTEDVDVRVGRIFNTYGPEMRHDDGRVISNFITQALTGNSLTIYGDGHYSRSPCYVNDMIEAFLTLMKSDDKRHQMPFNLGNTTEISIRELAEIIKKKTGSASPIIYLDPVSDDPKQRCPDIARVKHELGWFPKTSLSEGLDKTIAFFRKKLPTLASGDGSEQAQAFSDLSFEGSIRQERDDRP